jgi:hypothetical protein
MTNMDDVNICADVLFQAAPSTAGDEAENGLGEGVRLLTRRRPDQGEVMML